MHLLGADEGRGQEPTSIRSQAMVCAAGTRQLQSPEEVMTAGPPTPAARWLPAAGFGHPHTAAQTGSLPVDSPAATTGTPGPQLACSRVHGVGSLSAVQLEDVARTCSMRWLACTRARQLSAPKRMQEMPSCTSSGQASRCSLSLNLRRIKRQAGPTSRAAIQAAVEHQQPYQSYCSSKVSCGVPGGCFLVTANL